VLVRLAVVEDGGNATTASDPGTTPDVRVRVLVSYKVGWLDIFHVHIVYAATATIGHITAAIVRILCHYCWCWSASVASLLLQLTRYSGVAGLPRKYN
jgi:hypothetical protein